MEQSTVVGMGEVKVLRVSAGVEESSFTLLTALGLGSCIGICMYDASARLAGMAHVVLPESTGKFGDPPGKFADTAVPELIDEMMRFGGARRRMVAAIAGGAQLFSFASQESRMGIGDRNASSVIQALRKAGIPLLAQDVGGKQGQTVRLSAVDGRISVRSIGQPDRQLIVLGEASPVAGRMAA